MPHETEAIWTYTRRSDLSPKDEQVSLPQKDDTSVKLWVGDCNLPPKRALVCREAGLTDRQKAGMQSFIKQLHTTFMPTGCAIFNSGVG